MSKYETRLQVGDDLLTAALEYNRRGLSVIPIKAGTKKPALRSWKSFQQTPADEATLRDMFDGRDDLGLAVVFGNVSGGLTCRDFDDAESYHRWVSGHPDLARTLPTVATGRPGFHVYHRSDVRKIIKYPDGELRGAGYCLLPPSIHPNGHRYRWIVPLGDTIPLIDPCQVGLALCETERTECTEGTESNCSVHSVPSVHSVSSHDGDAHRIEHAIRSSLPSRSGLRHRQVFELARALKAVPSLHDADASSLQPYVREWYTLALPYIDTKAFEETWIDFLNAWPNVNFPKGSEPMAKMFHAARQAPIPTIAERYEQPQVRLLVSLCRELQRHAGQQPFFLSVRTAGRLLGVTHIMAWRWLWLLEQDGVLLAIERGSKKTSKATRFKYTPDIT